MADDAKSPCPATGSFRDDPLEEIEGRIDHLAQDQQWRALQELSMRLAALGRRAFGLSQSGDVR